MLMSRKSPTIICSKSDIDQLELLAVDLSEPRIAKRAAMVLECIKGSQVKDVAAMFSERPNTVILWRNRFAQSGISGLKNLPRGRTKDVYGEPFRNKLLSLLKEDPPDGHSYWTGALLANALDVPLDAVWRYLRNDEIHLLDYRHPQKPSIIEVNQKAIDIPLQITWKEDGNMSSRKPKEYKDEKLDIEIVARVKDKNGVIIEKVITVNDALPSLDEFDLSTKEGFLTDFDVMEKSMLKARDEMTLQLSKEYVEQVSKKNKK